jgi:hypothetical protein
VKCFPSELKLGKVDTEELSLNIVLIYTCSFEERNRPENQQGNSLKTEEALMRKYERLLFEELEYFPFQTFVNSYF